MKIFDWIMNAPTWLISTFIYVIGIGCLGLVMFGLPGCKPLEILPELCYTDKTGTYLCPEEETIYIDPPKQEYDRTNTCMMMYGIDPDQWRLCMDPDNDRYYDPYYQERKEFREELYRDKLEQKGMEAIA